MMTCRPCLKFGSSADVPSKFNKHRKGSYGILTKKKENGEQRPKKELVRALKEHTDNPLHIYSCIKEEEDEKQERDHAKEN